MVVITPVGTSLFSNFEQENYNLDKKRVFEQPVSRRKEFHRHLKTIGKNVLSWARDNRKRASAEVSSLRAIQKQLNQPLDIRFLTSDTLESYLAAEILQELFCDAEERAIISGVQIEVVDGLQVKDYRRFVSEGLSNLIDHIQRIYEQMYDQTIINITGGYKVTIPYLTMLGQVYQIPLYYIFEDTGYEETVDLIKIPQAPFSVNWGLVEKHSQVFERLDNGVAEWQTFKYELGSDLSAIEACVWECDNEALLSPIGQILWEHYRNFFLFDVVKGGPYFSDSAGNKRQVHEALRELYQRLLNVVSTRNTDIKTEADLIRYINLSKDDYLRHGENPGKDIFIFKSTNENQVRLAYSLRGTSNVERPRIVLFDYVRGNFTHEKVNADNYMAEFKRKGYSLAVFEKEDMVTTLTLPK